MKKKVLSLLFACIMILSVLAISGCKSDELQAQIDENATKAETAVTDAAAKAETDLAAAKAELEALIAAGDAADAKDLADAVAKLNSAIDAAKAAATTADDALKADLTAAIAAAKKEAADGASAALDAAVKKLNDAVALKVDATAYNKAVADLEAAVAAAKKTASDADAALETKLTAAIATAKAEAVADAKTYVDAKVAELVAADAKNVADFNKAIADVNTAIDAAEKLAADADVALKAELTTAIEAAKAAAVTEAKAYVDAQVKLLADADKTSADAFNKAIDNLETAVATAQATAEKYAAADAALKAALETAIADAKAAAIADAKAYVDAQVDELKKLDAADKVELASKIQAIKNDIAAAEAAAKKLAEDGDEELSKKLEDLATAVAGVDAAVESVWDGWNEATDDVIAKLYDLELAYESFLKGGYDEVLLPKALMIVTETRTKLLRATNVAAVEAEYKYAGEFFKVVVEIYATYEPYAKIADLYYQNEIADLEAAFAKAVEAIVASTDETENVLAINTTLADDLYKVPNKAAVIKDKLTAKTEDDIRMLVTYEDEWADLINEVQKMIDAEDDGVKAALDFDAIQNLLNLYADRYEVLLKLKDAAEKLNAEAEFWAKYFEAAASAQNPLLSKEDIEGYTTFVGEVEGWKFELGATNETNKKLLNSEMIDKAEKNFVARKDAIQEFAVELLNKLKSFGDGYVYEYSVENQEAVYAVKKEYDLFKAYIEDALNQELTADFVTAYETFEDVAYARATALAEANDRATVIEDEIVKFTTTLNNLTTFKTEYQKKMTDIDAAVAAWNEEYFADFASEAVVGHVNYDILDHAGHEALKALYAKKLGEIAKAMEVVVETFNADGFRKINLLSADEVAAAKDAWAKLITLVGNLGLNTDQIVVDTIIDLGENATTIDVANELYKKDLMLQAAQAAAYEKYAALDHDVLSADKVTIYDKTAVENMIAWYETYLGIKPSDAESVLPVVSVELVKGGVAINAEVYAAAKATYTAWATLVKEKGDDQIALEKEIAKFLNGTINTESEARYSQLMDLYNNFISGETVRAPYTAEQYKVDTLNKDLYYVDITALKAAGAEIADLIAKRDALLERIADLAEMTDDLLDVSKKDYNTQLIDKLEADMEAFTDLNKGFNCFADKEVILTQSREIIEIAVIYARAIENVGSVEPVAVRDDLTGRATAARNKALELIRTLAPEAWETSAEYAIAKAKLEVVEKTIAAYVASAKDSALLSSCYFNSVVPHIDEHVTVESLVKFENQDKDVDDLVEEVVDAVSDFIANAEIKN